jgi:hypothetical protein
MRQSLFIGLLLLISSSAFSQDSLSNSKTSSTNAVTVKRNIVKWNLSSLVFKNYHFTYERGLTKHISASISYRYMPKGTVPFESQLTNVINSNDINFSRFQMGNTAITPQLNFYLGKGNLKGFYLAPFGRFANFDISAPINYTTVVAGQNVTTTADFAGSIKSTSGGLMMGIQANLSKSIVLDFWLVGAHYGKSKGDLVFVAPAPLSAQEQAALQQSLNEISADPFTFTSTVNANGATIKTDGPWAGVRGLGIGIGFRF